MCFWFHFDQTNLIFIFLLKLFLSNSHWASFRSECVKRMGLTLILEFVFSVEKERGRTRKKRDFFGTIKKRLSRSKLRSKSMDPGEYDESLDSDPLNRSFSADRARDPSAHSTGKLVCRQCFVLHFHLSVYRLICFNSFVTLNCSHLVVITL